jgi:membrane protease YdiL (CAAX protease family)
MQVDRKTLLLIAFITEGGLFLLGIVLVANSDAALWSRIELSWKATGYALLFCVPMLAALYFVLRSRWSALSRFREEIEEKVRPVFANSKILDLLLIALLAGVGEELFFRGWLQSVLTGRFGILFGIILAGAIFGFAHFLSIGYALYAGLTGLYLGALYQVFGNLYIPMVVHALYDFIALVYLIGKHKGRETGLPAGA